MTDLIEKLPFELANIIYSYVGTHPVAQLIEDKLNEELISEFCIECSMYLAGDESKFKALGRDWNCYDGMCEYCYAEKLGTDVYTCDECCEKTYEYGRHNNTENGLYCNGCMMNRDENGYEVEE